MSACVVRDPGSRDEEPWHGGPTANLISGGLFTLALPSLIWLLALRVRRRRWRRAKELVDDLTA
jgi:hypothetical protein